MRAWKLKKGFDQRLRSRHPWVFSNELMESPKSILPGDLVEVQDYRGNFIARGYGNPHSLIAFRAMSFEMRDVELGSVEYLVSKLYTAWEKRKYLGFKQSFRICFSEADQMPGLILDRYVTEINGELLQILSYQLLTSGMDRFLNSKTEVFNQLVNKVFEQKLSKIDWDHTVLLQRNDVNVRKLEGLEVEEPKVVYNPKNISLTELKIKIPSVISEIANSNRPSLEFNVNLIEGQKTGFFLDQTHNIRLVIQALEGMIKYKKLSEDKPLKIIDLCCYMGQWSAQIAQYLSFKNVPFEVLLVDVSDLALKNARQNLLSYTTKVKYLKADVLKDLPQIEDNSYDVVISDPPAFVKNKKDLESGLHGYMKLNEQAFRIAKNKSIVASCTCSGLVQMTDFKSSLRKSIIRTGKKAQLIAEGGLGWDHPSLLQFPEGQYLKMLLHTVE